jgi:hypothetical protein
MHVALYHFSNGGVGQHDPRPTSPVINAMIGSGNGWSAERVEYEIGKITNRPLLNKDGSPAANHSVPAAIARAFYEGFANGGLTEEEAVNRMQAKNAFNFTMATRGFEVVGAVVLDEGEIPYHLRGEGYPSHTACLDPACHDRYFRDAVVWDDTLACKCCCDMPIARGIHMDCIRVVRNAELVKEDLTFMRAVEAGDTSAESTIATKKQVLRDIPQTFDLTTDTPEQLKAKWPAELPARE